MSLLDRLERRLGFLAISNLTLYLVIGQVVVYALMVFGRPEIAAQMYFSFDLFKEGEVWRVASFVLIPPRAHWLFLAFAWYIFYMMGSALEERWGAFRFNLYVLTSVLGVFVCGVIVPEMAIDNYFLAVSIMLAFAYSYPDFEILVFFVLPVKMRWLGLIAAGLVVVAFIGSSWPQRLVIIGSLINFPLFFAREYFAGVKASRRVGAMKEAKRQFESEPFHTCVRCGATDQSHPDREFRYRAEGAICSACIEAENPPLGEST